MDNVKKQCSEKEDGGTAANSAFFDNEQINIDIIREALEKSFPPEAIAIAKEAIVESDVGLAEALTNEQELFLRSAHTDSAKKRMAAAMSAGLQTEALEKRGFEELWGSIDDL